MVNVFVRRCPHQRILRELEQCELCVQAQRERAYAKAGPEQAKALVSRHGRARYEFVPRGAFLKLLPKTAAQADALPWLNDVQGGDAHARLYRVRGSSAHFMDLGSIESGCVGLLHPQAVLRRVDGADGSVTWEQDEALGAEFRKRFGGQQRTLAAARELAAWLAEAAPAPVVFPGPHAFGTPTRTVTTKLNANPLFQPGDEVVVTTSKPTVVVQREPGVGLGQPRSLGSPVIPPKLLVARVLQQVIDSIAKQIRECAPGAVFSHRHNLLTDRYEFYDARGTLMVAVPHNDVAEAASAVATLEARGCTNVRVNRWDWTNKCVELAWTEPGPATC